MSSGKKQVHVTLTRSLVEDVSHQLRQAVYWWEEFVAAGEPMRGDVAKTKRLEKVIERWKKALAKSEGLK